MANPWYPALSTVVHPDVDKAIKYIYDKVYAIKKDSEASQQSIESLTQPGGLSRLLHAKDKNFIQESLQSDGSHPLNVANLLGILAQPQNAAVPVNGGSSTSPINPPSTPTDGQLAIQGGQLFYYNSVTGTWIPVGAVAVILEDTRANRLTLFDPANQPTGTMFFETDTGLTYVTVEVLGVFYWVYLSGIVQLTQTDLAAFAATLLASDTNLLAFVTDYTHTLQWDGTAWKRGAGDTERSNTFYELGSAPPEPGWHACDGATVSYLKYDGTLGSRVLPNLVGTPAVAIGGNVYSNTITPAVVPAVTTTVPAATASTGTALAGVTQPVLTALTSGGGGTNLPGVVTLPGVPVANFPVEKWFRQ